MVIFYTIYTLFVCVEVLLPSQPNGVNNLYIFVWIQHGCLANTLFALDPSNSGNPCHAE